MYDLDTWKRQKKALHLTFDELAKKADVAVSTLYAIFGGKTTDPRIETVQAIEKALDINDEVTLADRMSGWIDTAPEKLTSIEYEMLQRFRDVGYKHGEQAQRALITVAEKML